MRRDFVADVVSEEVLTGDEKDACDVAAVAAAVVTVAAASHRPPRPPIRRDPRKLYEGAARRRPFAWLAVVDS